MAEAVPTHLGWVSNPEAIDGLNRSKPDAEQHPSIIGRYDVTPKGGRKTHPNGPWVWCSHCQASTHWNGFVVVDDAGQRYLIGQDCGALHYGGDRFRHARNEFQRIEHAQSLDRRLAAISALLPNAMEEIESLLQCSALAAVEAKRAEFQKASPNAAARLQSPAQTGLGLSAHERARGLKGAGFISVNLGPIEGASLIYSDIRSCCADLIAAIKEAANVPDESTLSEKSQALKKLDQSTRALLKSKDECAHAYRFFLKRNYRRLARWSTPLHRFISISHDGDTLIVWDEKVGQTALFPLEAQRFPAMKVCKRLLTEQSEATVKPPQKPRSQRVILTTKKAA